MKRLKYFFFLPAGIALIIASCSKGNSDAAEQSGNWVVRAEFSGNVRYAAVSFVINDSAYITTGFDNTYRYNDLWVYSVNNNSWYQRASIPVPAGAPGYNGRSNATAFAINGKGYVTTGLENVTSINVTGRLKDTWEYTQATNSWVQKTDFPEPNDPNGNPNGRYDATGFALGSLGYVTCGTNGPAGSITSNLYSFNPAGAGTWTVQASSPTKRTGAQVFVYNNVAYVMGGIGSNGIDSYYFTKFDPTANLWTELNQTRNVSTDAFDDDYTDISRSYGVAFVMNNGTVPKGYLAVGTINGGNTVKTWEYDFPTDRWARKTPYESTRSARSYANSFVVKGRGFVGLGTSSRSGGQALDNLDEWNPADAYNAND
ncbi:Kelch repeat-containing protein [Chitinophagaceae bacterium LWZ2-11]